MVRAAGIGGAADLDLRMGGLAAPATAFLSRELVVSTRRGCLAMAHVAVMPVASFGRFRRCNRVLPSKLPKGLRARSFEPLKHWETSRFCWIC